MVGGLDRGTYRNLSHGSHSVPHSPLLLYFDRKFRHERTRLISVRVRRVGLHAGINSSDLHSWLSHLLSLNAPIAPVV